MELVPIFVNAKTLEGLYAIRYDGEVDDEYVRLFDLWTDIQYVMMYLRENEDYLKADYFKNIYRDDLINEILDEAEELEKLMNEYSNDGFFDCGNNLQMLFRPLNKNISIIPPPHQKTKASIRDRKNFPKDILRVYALRLGKNTFVITGGAIKLVDKMIKHPDTIRELEKLDEAKKFLKNKNLNTYEDLNFYYDE
jgi:hypothetical protein